MNQIKETWLLCNREELIKVLNLLNVVVPKKTPKPILESILFNVTKDGLFLTATDLEVGLECKINSEFYTYSDEFKFLLVADKLISILKEEECDEINFRKVDNTFFEIQADENKYKIFSLRVEDFPVFSFKDEKTFNLSSNILKELISKVSYSAASEATRYTMNSVLLEIEDFKLNLVATDGKRLAKYTLKIKDDIKTYSLLPLKGIELLSKIIDQVDNSIEIYIENNLIQFRAENISMFARLLQGSYPQYNKVIPCYASWKCISFERDLLEKGIKKSLTLTNKDSRAIKMSFDSGTLRIYSNDPNVGESSIKIQANIPVDLKLDIAFNATYILDIVKALKGNDTIEMYVNQFNTPAVFTSSKGYEAIVMPLNQ